jgi:ribose-phosphate pyrophosphokinase
MSPDPADAAIASDRRTTASGAPPMVAEASGGHPPLLFALAAGRAYGERVTRALGVPLAPVEERDFEDGEHKSRALVSVRGRAVYVVESLHGDGRRSVNDRLCRLLFFLGALKEASAASVTAVVPYLCYSRKDRQTKPRDPVTTRYVARLVEAAGADRVVTLDVHNLAAFQNAFRRPTEHLEARWVLAAHVAGLPHGGRLSVVAPDAGGVPRADRFRAALDEVVGAPVASAFAEKARSGGRVTGNLVVGDVEGRTAIVIDDMISTGGTMARTARRCLELGAERVVAAATHAVFSPGADSAIADPALDAVVVTDSAGPARLESPAAQAKVTVLESAPLVAEAIRRLHEGGSLLALREGPALSGAGGRGRGPARCTRPRARSRPPPARPPARGCARRRSWPAPGRAGAHRSARAPARGDRR